MQLDLRNTKVKGGTMVGSIAFTAEYVDTYDMRTCDQEMSGNICCEDVIEPGHVVGIVIMAIVL